MIVVAEFGPAEGIRASITFTSLPLTTIVTTL
jgi:hypothetical protein